MKISFWIIAICLFTLLLNGMSQNNYFSTNLPVISLQTNEQVINADSTVVINMGIIYNGPGEMNSTNDSYNDYDGNVAIKKRGTTSLSFPKQSYSIETQDNSGQNLNVSLIDLPKENDWVLYGPYADKSLMRNVIIYEIARRMGQYAPRTRFCELLMNGEYMGVYVLVEKIKRDDNRVDIARLNENDTIGDELTGGYIIKKDSWNSPGWVSKVGKYIYFEYYYPDGDEIHETQKDYIQGFINNFELVLDTLTNINNTSFTSLIDFQTFIDHMILNELSKNVDAYRKSTHFYKDKDSNGGKLKMGPIWDYNIAFGNNHDYSAYTVTEFIFSDPTFADNNLFWFRKLMSFPVFEKNFQARYHYLRKSSLHKDSIFSIIDSCSNFLLSAQNRNFQKWDILGKYVWPNYFIGDSYEEEIEILKAWINDRLIWMDNTIIANQPPSNEGNNLFMVYPNPFKTELTLHNQVTDIHSLTFRLLNSYGIEIFREEIDETMLNLNTFYFDLEHLYLSDGFYFYSIIWNTDNYSVGKLIKCQ
jgi:hypothetical protein